MTKILGLDLGVASIGWAYIEQTENAAKILGTGVRIIPLFDDERDEFSQGNAISKHQKRTLKRTQRKGYDRYQLRKFALKAALEKINAVPDATLFSLTSVELYGLRHKAVTEKITLQELGRIWLHLNQKRGYKGSRTDDANDTKQTQYVAEVNTRFKTITELGLTVGKFFHKQLLEDPNKPIKGEVFPREAYMQEFDLIWNKQSEYYGELLNDVLKNEIRNRIIYYQRPLKSKKELVSVCEFEGKWYEKGTKKLFAGPKVTPRSAPLFQVCKLWESINNITIKHKTGSEYQISNEQKKILFDYLNVNSNLSPTELFKLLKIGKNDGYTPNEQIRKKGIQGNTTKAAILNILKDNPSAESLTRFELTIEQYQEEYADTTTGELIKIDRQRITPSYEQEPLYKLWHLIYSSQEKDLTDLKLKLQSDFPLSEEEAEQLLKLDFTRGGHGNKSARAIRNILPYLQQGKKYSEACALAGYNHSDSRTKDENLKRDLEEKLCLLPKNSLRQPVVEKILNQMIHLVNAILEAPEFGRPDEIRVELARELKQSKDERNDAYNGINERERENEKLRKQLLQHPEFQKSFVSKRDLDKYRLWLEFEGISPYEPNKQVSLSALFSNQYDIEHIIPRSRLFDDSYSNKTFCRRELNSGENGKNQQTAYEFMQSKPEFDQFIELVEKTYKTKKIGRAKRDKLLMTGDKIPSGFIDRQLRQTQYIAKKAREILDAVCRNVHASSGGVTDYLRDQWGYNEILEQLQLERYRAVGQTEMRDQKDKQGNIIKVERIKDWSKRDDHRHHAIDALVVACTNAKIIKRLNDLNQTVVAGKNESKQDALKASGDMGLKTFIAGERIFKPAEVSAAAEQILVSYKQGRKVTAKAKRMAKVAGELKVVQKNIPVPRGPLHEESVYGKIKVPKRWKLDHRFELAHLIANAAHKKLVQDRLKAHNGNATKAFSEPIWLDKKQTKKLTHVELNEWQYVLSYSLSQITKPDDVKWIVDKAVRDVVREHLEKHENNVKKAFGDLQGNPVWLNKEKNIQVKRVRMFTGLDVVEPIWKNEKDEYIGFVKPGSNHHIALYIDKDGSIQEHVATFFHAVQRELKGLPAIIKNPADVWEKVAQKENISQEFLEKLPDANWSYKLSMKANDLFVFGLDGDALNEALRSNDLTILAKHLFRVRKLTSGNYWFQHHYETEPRESVADKQAGRAIQASKSTMTGIKVKIDRLGRISLTND
ncbi:MAG: type II CRISPR RNA-guided endonuclease Cas9 [Bacteroidetes bacterium]|nr:type II CRISPR RNA-guided endonuclease Cas9 [Bacteroidota bacterium]